MMNKRILLFFMLFTLFVMCFAEEVVINKDKLNISTYALIQSQKSGGGVSFSFPVFQKSEFVIRNETNLNLYFTNIPLTEAKLITIGDKLVFGSLKTINGFKFRSYGYCRCEFGPSWSSSNKIFSKAPLILECGGAGGFEFIYSESKSFFVEYGGGAVVKAFGPVALEDFASGSFKGGYVCLTVGARYYF